MSLADLPNTPNPFNNVLKRGKYVVSGGRKWLLDEKIAEFNYQFSGYSYESFIFKVSFFFDSPLE